jgi:prepilin signal peptidase PulO-like enzyme (type II secretory pathway)
MELLYVYYLVVFYLGTMMGSFLNVVALDLQKLFRENDLAGRSEIAFLARHITKRYFWQSLVTRRSKCDSCEKALGAHELFPLFSYALQRGKCRTCGDTISQSHVVAELLAGVYFLGIFYVLFWQEAIWSMEFVGSVIFWFAVFGALFVAALFDYRTKLLPDITLYITGGLILIHQVMAHGVEAWWYAAAGVCFAALFWSLWLVSRGTWIGFGDGKLALITGLMFGFSAGFTALAVSFWVGAAVAVVLLAIRATIKKHWGIGIKTAIPFGPFLVIGMWYVFVSGTNLFILG